MRHMTFSFTARTFHHALAQVAPAAGHDHRQELREIFAHAHEDTLHLLASDGYRLHSARVPLRYRAPLPLIFTIPLTAATDQTRAHWAHTEATGELSVDEHSITLQLGAEQATTYTRFNTDTLSLITAHAALDVLHETLTTARTAGTSPPCGHLPTAHLQDILTTLTSHADTTHPPDTLTLTRVHVAGQHRILVTTDTTFTAILLPALPDTPTTKTPTTTQGLHA